MKNNVIMKNIYNMTTGQVKGNPIKNEKGEVIGQLDKADKNYVYGVIYDESYLPEKEKSCSVEIVLN